jgi:Concanavalin A-like lectin/glucanases superfamily/VanZ like family
MRAILALYLLAMLAFFLWPFEFGFECRTCRNEARLVADEGRVEFPGKGVVRSVAPPVGLYERLTEGDGLTVEAWLTSAGLDQTGPARIVSYSLDPEHRNFTLGQEGGDLVFRLRTTATDLNGTASEVVVPGVVEPGKRQHVVVSFDFSAFRVFVDGALRARTPAPGGTLSNWDPDYPLVIGNEATGDRPWLGTVDRVRIYDRPVHPGETDPGAVAAFEFSGNSGDVVPDASGVRPPSHLERPEVFRNADGAELLTPKPRGAADFAGNFVLFVPFGAALFLLLRDRLGDWRRSAAAVFVGTLLAATALESAQFFVPARTSSIIDWASGVLGSMIGCLAATRLQPYLRRW